MRAQRYKLLLSKIVTRYWPIVLVGWLALAVGLKLIAPRWDDIAADGDLAFLPDTVPSAIGQSTLEQAFPGENSRSQIVVVVANEQKKLAAGDLAFAMELARRLHYYAARSNWEGLSDGTALAVQLDAASDRSAAPVTKSIDLPRDEGSSSTGVETFGTAMEEVTVERVVDNLSESIEIETALSEFWAAQESQDGPFARLPEAYELRAWVSQMNGEIDQAKLDADTAQLIRDQHPLLRVEVPSWAESIRDVWSWRSSVVGHKLGSQNQNARLIAIQLSSDFTATANIDIMNGVEALVDELSLTYAAGMSSQTRVEVSGSAAVGADMLRAASSGVRKTEVVTIVLVLVILASVYRAPFLVAIPLTSIGLSLVVATSVVSLLARDPADPNSVGLGVFTTTRIFIVVLLFGAGTDFCLFFLARNREMLREKFVKTRKQMYRLVASSWRSVHDALVASALTTIVGLAMMWFSRFEKFQFSGPIIAISLGITLIVCLTFTPALLSALGRVAFWPLLRSREGTAPVARSARTDEEANRSYWGRLAETVAGRPGMVLCCTIAILLVPAIYGVTRLGRVTYDLTEELSESAPSRRGARLIANFFPTRDSSPITVLLERENEFADEDELREACAHISSLLYTEGVDAVRSLTDPLGDYPPGKRMGLFAQDAWRRRVLAGHRITKERYVSTIESKARRIARFDVVIEDNPFSLQAGATLKRVREVLEKETANPDSAWLGANATVSGTTVGITDLRSVTQGDQRRIQLLVTLGVWLVLVLMLRQVVLSTYLIFTVLLSYFATLGVTYASFAALYGADYGGLDWKVPIFLFVILVAVGQDYNVYLVTRIFEEGRQYPWRKAVSRALEKTGGIITSCGLVMAGTFIAMTSPAVLHALGGYLPASWIDTQSPVLRGITELGFALAFGVLLDTLVVRSILVPAFVVLWQQRRTALAS